MLFLHSIFRYNFSIKIEVPHTNSPFQLFFSPWNFFDSEYFTYQWKFAIFHLQVFCFYAVDPEVTAVYCDDQLIFNAAIWHILNEFFIDLARDCGSNVEVCRFRLCNYQLRFVSKIKIIFCFSVLFLFHFRVLIIYF